MNRKQKAASVALAALFACGALAGCDALTTIDSEKDYAQVIAEVNLLNHEDFAEGGKFAQYKDAVSTVEISKRDLVASYVSSGYSLQQQYGMSYSQIFPTLAQSLANRELYVQYAKVDFLATGNEEGKTYSVEDYKKATEGDMSDTEREVAGIGYFLEEEEKAKAVYDLRKSINTNIDSIEEDIIKVEEDTDSYTPDSDVRTLPSGAETENEDYYPETYAIWTGKEGDSALGEYEKLPGSTRTTRRKAYIRYLANLRANSLINKSENASDIEETDYFDNQLKSSYSAKLIEKMTDKLEKEVEKDLNAAWATDEFKDALANDANTYATDRAAFEQALDGMSDTSFVLASPTDSTTQENDAYGFVINILLPFSDLQTQALGEVSADYGDEKGNHFAARARLLEKITATDLRGTWFTGKTDYSFKAADDAFTNGDAGRDRLFFEHSFEKSDKYEEMEKYFGKYTYNGTVTETDASGKAKYTLTPAKIGIDGFLTEMKNYLAFAMKDYGAGAMETITEKPADYYAPATFYKDNGEVDYSKFVYEMGKLTYFEQNGYDANKLFVKGSAENIALSVINELSFAYNTDTGGLNSYLGYSISPYKTNYMSEFEYAAQLVVKEGAGSYAVVPTDYGWHIIYCTFSFADAAQPFDFNYEEKDDEGTFSALYFEALKSDAVSTAAGNKQSKAISTYSDACSTIYEGRFKDLMNLV